MKKVLWMTIVMLCMTLTVTAQTVKVDKLSKVTLGSRVNLTMDFSKAAIHDRSEAEFAKYEKDWEEDKPSIIEKFRAAANFKLDKELKLGFYEDADYQMTVTVKTITTKGFMICDAVMTDKSGQEFFKVENLKGTSDSFFTPGTKLARIKFWAALTGGALGTIMKDRL
jgi:uncharacterized protein YqfB (UPF0267 family)